jgi:hypothetical protein
LPTNSPPPVWKTKDHTEAYWCGWLDGRYAEKQTDFTGNSRLARWDTPEDRLDYYRGHREGRRERLSAKKPGKASGKPTEEAA